MQESDESVTRQVSIAMATYNGARFLAEQLGSLSRQTLLPFELVVTDDGSADETQAIVREFAETAPFPVRLFSNEQRLGYARNFMKAASLCTGPLIAYCDQDDFWEEDKLARSASFFEDPEVMMTCHTASLWNGNELTGGYYPHFESTEKHAPVAVDPFLLVPGFTIAFRSWLRDIPNERGLRHTLNLGQKHEPMAHDAWTIFLAASIGSIVTIGECLARYRQHGLNVKGAPDGADARTGLQLALARTDYTELAALEADCAEATAEYSVKAPSQFRMNVLATSRNFVRRARFHRLRSEIYSADSNVVRRTASFLQLVFSGAYGADSAHTRLGLRAGVKDLCLGVPGFYRLAQRKQD